MIDVKYTDEKSKWPYVILTRTGTFDELDSWLSTNIGEKDKTWKMYYIVFKGVHVEFKNLNDAILFKLAWG